MLDVNLLLIHGVKLVQLSPCWKSKDFFYIASLLYYSYDFREEIQMLPEENNDNHLEVTQPLLNSK